MKWNIFFSKSLFRRSCQCKRETCQRMSFFFVLFCFGLSFFFTTTGWAEPSRAESVTRDQELLVGKLLNDVSHLTRSFGITARRKLLALHCCCHCCSTLMQNNNSQLEIIGVKLDVVFVVLVEWWWWWWWHSLASPRFPIPSLLAACLLNRKGKHYDDANWASTRLLARSPRSPSFGSKT